MSQNDILLNGGFPVFSDTAIELSVDGEGNFWGRTSDDDDDSDSDDNGSALFIPGVDSNSLNVVDSFPSDEPFALDDNDDDSDDD